MVLIYATHEKEKAVFGRWLAKLAVHHIQAELSHLRNQLEASRGKSQLHWLAAAQSHVPELTETLAKPAQSEAEACRLRRE